MDRKAGNNGLDSQVIVIDGHNSRTLALDTKEWFIDI